MAATNLQNLIAEIRKILPDPDGLFAKYLQDEITNPTGGGGSQTLSQVLANGNDGGGQNIVNVGDIALAGLTGATAAARFVGGTNSGAPVSGTFSTGDFVVDRSGSIWICTAGGTPGTWAQVGAAGAATALLLPAMNPAAAAIITVPYLVGTGTGGSAALVDQTMYLFPFVVQASRTLNGMACRTNAPASAGATLRFGVYGDSAGKPAGSPLYDSGAVAATAAFATVPAAPALALAAGRYWAAVAQQGAPATNVTPVTVTGPGAIGGLPADTVTNALTPKNYVGFTQAAIGTGALPAIGTLVYVAATGGSNHPAIALTF